MNSKIINFDMDGTIANLYSVENWLAKLRSYDPSPYEEAAPLVRLSTLAFYIHKAQKNGWKVNIISWLSKDPDPNYGEAVTSAKISWLKKHLPSVNFDEIIIVPYGTPKHSLSNGILFDDEVDNRKSWFSADETNFAFDVNNILGVMKSILC